MARKDPYTSIIAHMAEKVNGFYVNLAFFAKKYLFDKGKIITPYSSVLPLALLERARKRFFARYPQRFKVFCRDFCKNVRFLIENVVKNTTKALTRPAKARHCPEASKKLSKFSVQFSTVLTKKWRIFGLFLGVVVGLNLIYSIPTSAIDSNNEVYVENYVADYYLSKDEAGMSRLRVVEQIDMFFPDYSKKHGLTRAIPYTNQAGTNITVKDPHNFPIKIQHDSQAEDPHKVELRSGNVVVYVGDANHYVTGKHQYVLEYEFERVITDFGSHQELYWDTNGDLSEQRAKNTTVRVHFEDEAIQHGYTGNSWCYVGAMNENGSERCTIRETTDGVSFQTSNLAAYENLTFDLEFKPGTFVIPEPQQDLILMRTMITECVVGGILIIFALGTYVKIRPKRKYYKSLFKTVQYLPPREISVAEAEEVCMGINKGSEQVATLLDLAVKHKIELVKTPESKKWSIRIIDANLTAEEEIVLRILRRNRQPLAPGETFEIKSRNASNSMTELLRNFQLSVKENLVVKGLLEAGEPKKMGEKGMKTPKIAQYRTTRTEKMCVGLVVLAVLWFIFCIFGIGYIEDNVVDESMIYAPELFWPIMIAVMILVAGILFGAGIWCGGYASRTKEGLAMSRYLEGLKLYIEMAEKDRLAYLQSVDGADTSHQGIVRLYEKLLPYAIIFGQEKTWLDEMGRYYAYDDVENPNWYVGTSAFSSRDFTRVMTSISQTANSSIRSASPSSSSSSSSGGGGGGFSGGGGGGGGIGSW